MNYKTYKDTLETAVLFLQRACQGEIQALWQAYKHWDLTAWLKHWQEPVSPKDRIFFDQALLQLKEAYPLQYILGVAEFYGRSFMVNEAVLIPRPETEWIIAELLQKEADVPQCVVDLGTGSSCIASTLALERPSWEVYGLDISQAALAVAQKNVATLAAPVHLLVSDTLAAWPQNKTIDLFVSNPPYISEAEQVFMDESVKKYEPKEALYAQHEGLAIYEKIAKELPAVLAPSGRAYLEIGFQQGSLVQTLLAKAFPKRKVVVKKDWCGQDRLLYISAE